MQNLPKRKKPCTMIENVKNKNKLLPKNISSFYSSFFMHHI